MFIETKRYRFIIISSIIGLLSSCHQEQLSTVSVEQFRTFITETNYVTDAEKYGWSIKQINIQDFEVLDSLTWYIPDGYNPSKSNYAVTQVSYNDAEAYAQWSHTRIPTYDEYWSLVRSDTRPINQSTSGILPLDQVNIVGNVWDITEPDALGRIRLAGGSYLCDALTCNGTSPDRELFVDVETGNTHIGFSVISTVE